MSDDTVNRTGHSQQARRSSSLLDTPEPTGPDVLPILQIHRGSDGFVTFHAKRPTPSGGVLWTDLGAVAVSRLESMFPTFAQALIEDSFFSINAFYRAGREYETINGRRVRYRHAVTGLDPALRKQEALRYLNACYADLDSHDGRFDVPALVGAVLRAQDRGDIPPASIITRSGRGVWLFWLLADVKNPEVPPVAWPEKIQLYLAIQQVIVKRLHALGADAGATDAARVTRVPGSINTKAALALRRVKYWIQGDEAGGFLYTLPELSQFFGIELRARHPVIARAVSEAEQARKRNAWRARWRLALSEFETLRLMRGSFREGCRNRAALLYAVLLRKNGMQDTDVSEHVHQLGRECLPALARYDCEAAIRQSRKYATGNLTHEKCSAWLGVSVDESRFLQRWRPIAALPPTRPDARNAKARYLAIQDELDGAGGIVPSQRDMAGRLAARGYPVSHTQVRLDYQKLGVSSEQRAGRRKHPTLQF